MVLKYLKKMNGQTKNKRKRKMMIIINKSINLITNYKINCNPKIKIKTKKKIILIVYDQINNNKPIKTIKIFNKITLINFLIIIL